ncbi:MAG: hypothetical protein NZ580_02615 [Bacteroidia bacterium]|nr:hypothetical protein [Bacteroidia bacterium]MDW8236514.1 hypothetical protein [Bacteroidia bacterium]
MHLLYLTGLMLLMWAQNVGIGTNLPSHTLHVAGGHVRLEGLAGTGTALVGLNTQGVTYRFGFSGNANDMLRGDGTWGPDAGDWRLLGNTGTNPASHFLGTTDAQPLILKTNNTERMRILSDGRVLIRTNSPLIARAVLQINGSNDQRAIFVWKTTSSGTPAVLGIATDDGPKAGVVGIGRDNPDGVGSVGMVGVVDFPHGYLGPGIVGTGDYHGVVAYAENTTGDRSAGRFQTTVGTQTLRVLVAAFVGGTQYKIWGRLEPSNTIPTTSTVISDTHNNLYALACPESPEIFFMDRGEAELTGEAVRIGLDPALSFNLYVDAQYPMYVFLQPIEEDCGLYVAERSLEGFTVRSSRPNCRTRFYWWMVARRNDTYTPERLRLSKHVGVRLPVVPPTVP